jgi:hypothetical protein
MAFFEQGRPAEVWAEDRGAASAATSRPCFEGAGADPLPGLRADIGKVVAEHQRNSRRPLRRLPKRRHQGGCCAHVTLDASASFGPDDESAAIRRV